MSKFFLKLRDFEVKTGTKILVMIVLVVMLVIGVAVYVSSYSNNVSKELADNLIRLHVVANSDSAEDQELKRDVRDVIIGYMKGMLKDSRDVEQTRYIINSNIGRIQEIVKNEILKKNKNYNVAAALGNYPFPTKAYGDIVLPSGNYQALRVTIGRGEGANWWCVLFPPLCFVDATHGTVPDSAKQNLKNVLTKEEYSIVTSVDSEDIPVKIKFKIVEVFQDSRIKIASVINKFFK